MGKAKEKSLHYFSHDKYMTSNSGVMALSPRQTLNNQRVQGDPVRNHYFKNLKIATWNVRIVFEARKLDNSTLERKRLQIDISETRWPQSGKCATENGTFFYSENNDKNHRNGVGITLTTKLAEKW